HALAGEPSTQLRTVVLTGGGRLDAIAQTTRAILESALGRWGLVTAGRWSDGRTVYPRAPRDPSPAELAEMLEAMTDPVCAGPLIASSPQALQPQLHAAPAFDNAIVAGSVASSLGPGTSLEQLSTLARVVRGVQAAGAIALDADDPGLGPLAGSNLEARL